MKANQDKLFQELSQLAQSSQLSASERGVLSEFQQSISRGGDFESQLISLRNRLLPLVVSQKLSPELLDFYKKLRADRKIGLGEGNSLLQGLISGKK